MAEAAMKRETVRRQKRTWRQPMRALRKGTHDVRDDRASGAGDGPPDVERCESADQAGNRQTQMRLSPFRDSSSDVWPALRTVIRSTPVARPGHKIVLSLEIDPNLKMHVYAPGVEGYIPIEWKTEEGAAAKLQPVAYPASEKLRLEAIGETVPVYRNRVIVKQEITFGQEAALTPLVNPAGELTLKGSFRYQALITECATFRI
jgi:hypothetical protein